MGLLKKFLFYFGEHKKYLPYYVIFSFVVALLELIGVALIYPLVIYIMSNSDTKQPVFIAVIGIGIALVFLTKNLAMLLYVYFQAKLTQAVELEAKLKLMKYFVYSTYSKGAKVPLHEKGKIMGTLVSQSVNNFLFRILNLVVNVIIFLVISIFLIIKFTLASFFAVTCAVLFVFVQHKILKPTLNKYAQKIKSLTPIQNKHSNEILLNLKGIKISANEDFFFNRYKNSLKDMYELNRKLSFYGSIPPYVIEPFIILILFVLISVIAMQTYSTPDKMMASFALIASAMFRLSPITARIQTNINGIQTSLPFLKELLNSCDDYKLNDNKYNVNKNVHIIEKSIKLENVFFEYEENKTVLDNINLEIKKGEFIGITGLSGAGKTTLVDLIVGLYKPQKGNILIDDKFSDCKLNIGYIPQEYFVLNAPIRENVSFGNNNIDDNKVIEVLKMAQLYDYIVNNYKDGIYSNPFIDNTGLSQGQKQRLIIARALYNNPDLLILDEATSSLDIKTEDEICHVLNNLKGKVTIIAIAHRLSTIKSADRIVFMEQGKIIGNDTFAKLYETNLSFKNLVDLSKLK